MYDDETFPEFATYRDEDGVCSICGCKRGDPHIIRDHDDDSAADDATWD